MSGIVGTLLLGMVRIGIDVQTLLWSFLFRLSRMVGWLYKMFLCLGAWAFRNGSEWARYMFPIFVTGGDLLMYIYILTNGH